MCDFLVVYFIFCRFRGIVQVLSIDKMISLQAFPTTFASDSDAPRPHQLAPCCRFHEK